MTRRLRAAMTSRALLAVALLLAAVSTACGSTAYGGAPVKTNLPLTVERNGFTVSLVSVVTTTTASLVTVHISKVPGAAGPQLDAYAGMSREDVTLEGLDWKGPYNGEYKPLFDGSELVSVEEALELAPIRATGPDVQLTYRGLRFFSPVDGAPQVVVGGPWSFMFSPSVAQSVTSTQVAVNNAVAADDVVFSIDTVTFEPTQTLVRYRVASSQPGDLEINSVVARLADGTFVIPDRVERVDQGWQAYFAPLPSGAAVTLMLQPLLREVQQPLQLRFALDGRAIAAARAGDRVSVRAAIVVGGETLSVDNLIKGDGQFTLEVSNATPDRGGRVLPRFPTHAKPVTLTDDRGTTYTMVAAQSNFNKSDPVTMWAGGSSFVFAGELPAQVKELRLQVDDYGLQLRGPWAIVIAPPAQ